MSDGQLQMTGSHLRVIDGQGEVDEDSVAIPSGEAVLLDRIKHLGWELAAAKGQIAKMRAADPQAETIKVILEYWRTKTNHPKAQIPLDGSRAKAVKKMLKMYSQEQLLSVIDAVAARPYMGYGQRFCCPGEGRQRRDDIELIFRDESHVEQLLAVAADEEHEAYRRWLHGVLKEHPQLIPALAVLAVMPPHGDVIAAAAIWARDRSL